MERRGGYMYSRIGGDREMSVDTHVASVGRSRAGWELGQALFFTFCPSSVEPIDGDTGFSAAISWMHNLRAQSED